MPFYSLYRASAEAYLLIIAAVYPILCVMGWLLLGRAMSKRLRSYTYWYTPLAIGSSLSASAALLIAFVRFYDPRNYMLGSAVYLLCLAGVPFHLVSFARLWKTITSLPPSSGELPPQDVAAQDAGVWPPSPRR